MTSRVLDNEARYNRLARGYESLVRFGSFGQFARFYRAVAAALEPEPGGLILDLGCGPGTLVPYLLPKVGAQGEVVGIDISEEMIARATALSSRNRWRNTRFCHSDIHQFAPDREASAIVFCLSLTTMPAAARCFARALRWLKPGGQVAVLDSFLEPHRRLAALAIRAKAPLVGADPDAVSLAELQGRLSGPRVRRFHAGVYTLLSGRTPRQPLDESHGPRDSSPRRQE